MLTASVSVAYLFLHVPVAHAEAADVELSGKFAGPIAEAVAGVMTQFMRLFAWFLGVAVVTLDTAVYYTVITAGEYVKGLSAIGVAWRILRDIGNIILIFGFIAAGISLILDVKWYGSANKTIPMLLLSAVFLNFSLFVAQAVVDVTNLAATEVFVQINGGAPPSAPSFAGALQNIDDEPISNKIMGQLGLTTLYRNALGEGQKLTTGTVLITGFLGILLFLVASFVMFMLAFLLIARFVILVMLMIVAPIGIAGLAVPKMNGIANQWWSTLFSQATSAPVLLLMLYVALAIITDVHFLTGFNVTSHTAWSGSMNNQIKEFANVLLSFLVGMGFLLFVVILTHRMKAFGASWASKAAGFMTFTVPAVAAGLGVGGIARGYRYGAQRIPGFKDTAFARSTVAATRPLEKMTFDSSRIPGVAKIMKAGGAGAALPEKRDLSFRSMAASASVLNVPKQLKKLREKSDEEYAAEMKSIEESRARKDLEKEAKSGVSTLSPQSQKTLADMGEKELASLEGIKKGVDVLVKNLSPQQFESLMKSEKLTDTEKENVRSTRFREVNDLIAKAAAPGASQAAIDDARTALTKIGNKELTHAGSGFFATNFVADNMSNEQYEHLMKEGVLNAATRQFVDSRRKDRFDPQRVGPSSVAANIKTLKWNRDQINKLPASTVTDTAVLDQLGYDALNLIDILRRGNLSPTDRRKVGAYLENVASSPSDPRAGDFLAYYNSDPRIKRDFNIP